MTEKSELDTAEFKHTAPWVFGVLELPFGAAVGFLQTAVPWWLAKNGMSLMEIGIISGSANSPHAWKILWVPLIDIGPWRKVWYLAAALATALFVGVGTWVTPFAHSHLALYTGLAFCAQVGAATCSAALEALMATTTRAEHKGRAGGYFMAGNLGGTGALGALAIWLIAHLGPGLAGLILAGIVVASSLPVLWIVERRHAAPISELWSASWGRLKEVLKDLWITLRTREAITGIIICLAPVGCGALTNLFSGMAADYRASDTLVEMVNGLGGGIVGALGALVGGYITDLMNRRLAYVASGGVTALVAIAMALAPRTPLTYAWGTLAYNFANAISFAAFAGMVLEMVEHGAGVTTKYTLFVAASNGAINYSTMLDGAAPGLRHLGVTGTILFDALLTFTGIAVLGVMVLITRRFKPAPATA